MTSSARTSTFRPRTQTGRRLTRRTGRVTRTAAGRPGPATAGRPTATPARRGRGPRRSTRLPIQRSASVISQSERIPAGPRVGSTRGHRDQPGQPPGDRERLAVVLAQQRRPGGLEVLAVGDQVGDQPAGLQPVVDALAVERVHAGGGVADQRPVRPGDVRHRAAHREQRGGRAPALGRVTPKSARRSSAYCAISGLIATSAGRLLVARVPTPMFTSPVAEREDPAVAGEDRAVGVAQLEVRADPRVVGHRGVDVAAPGDAVHRVLVPLPAQQLAERGPDAVGDDQVPARDLDASRRRCGTRPRLPGRPRAVRRPPAPRRRPGPPP